MSDEKVRFTVQMPEQLREDAKRNAQRGELSNEVRGVFRRKAYGVDDNGEPSELEQKRAELREVRNHIDDLRKERADIETEIESKETRAARLEGQITELEEQTSQLAQSVEFLENMLHSGERMWPTRIKNAADVDENTAREIYQRLQSRNAELPDAAFTEPGVHTDPDWRDVDNTDDDTDSNT